MRIYREALAVRGKGLKRMQSLIRTGLLALLVSALPLQAAEPAALVVGDVEI